MRIEETVNEKICRMYVDNMSLEELKQFVYEDIESLQSHDDGSMLRANFWDLTELQQQSVRISHPDFDTGEE